jgi:hypothetical protein
VSSAKQRGTRWESAIVGYLRDEGWPYADRVPLSGNRDRGDVTLGPGSPVIEAKHARAVDLAGGVDEAETERVNAAAAVGVVWHHRRGKGSPADGYVTMTGATFVRLLRQAGFAEVAK